MVNKADELNTQCDRFVRLQAVTLLCVALGLAQHSLAQPIVTGTLNVSANVTCSGSLSNE